MRLAAVDIGSNTVHALVADVVRGQLRDVAHYVEMPELGSHVAKTGSIYAGLAFPIVVALITVVVGTLLLEDRHTESIWAEVHDNSRGPLRSSLDVGLVE